MPQEEQVEMMTQDNKLGSRGFISRSDYLVSKLEFFLEEEKLQYNGMQIYPLGWKKTVL